MKYNVIVYVGRFQPVHKGHLATIKDALTKTNKLILVVGSHNSLRDIKNPWTAPEREDMIRSCLSESENSQTDFVYVENRLYSDATWARSVADNVTKLVTSYNYINPTIGIIGNGKQDKDTAEYVNMFKQWDRIPSECITLGDAPIHATKIRELIFTGHAGFIESAVPPMVFNTIKIFTQSEHFAQLKEEFSAAIKYEKLYENTPFNSMNFYTADSVVIQSGHVLLIRRKHAPFKGALALPGGHVNPTETAATASIRELLEETGIKVPLKVLRGSLFCEKLFDHPDRSMRARVSTKNARTVTVAFGYKLDDSVDLPRVKASDDAVDARWFTFDEVANLRDQLMEDHADIIEYMISRVV